MSGADDKGDGTQDDKDDTGGAEIIAWPGREPKATTSAAGSSDRPADPAEALIVKTLASVTGRDPAELLHEIRGANPGTAPDDTRKIVDLGAVREARRREEDSTAVSGTGLWGPALKSGVQALFEGFARHTPASGELVIDAHFMKTHGLQLLGEVLSSVGGTLLGGGPTKAPEAAASLEATEPPVQEMPASSEPAPQPERRVDVQMDLGSLVAAVFTGLAGGWRKPEQANEPFAPASTVADLDDPPQDP